jgi:hypothetical protein
MRARVKGRTENALLKLPLDAHMFRGWFIQPQHGVRSKATLYRTFYAMTGPMYPLIRQVAPGLVTSSATLGRAMVSVV